ncbi:MAG: YbaK/EbsC family protein [Erysipelotrichaceae bacterium]|nr:YbaK/EbsC family protein [Erysipelotrichaceae bacterium]
MSFIKAKQHLEKFNLESRIIEFNESTATVALAAIALGVTEGEIAKSLLFIVNDIPILVIVAGDKKIDNHKFKEEFNIKAKMVPFDDVETLIGHAAGGVCPFGVNSNAKVYLDISLKKYKYVYPACGTSNTAVKLLIEELEAASNNLKWVDVCKE